MTYTVDHKEAKLRGMPEEIGIQDKANVEAKKMANYYFTKEDSRKQAIIIGFKDGVNWLLHQLADRKVKNKHLLAKDLREDGFTIREIAKIMGFKHPGSISHLLSKEHDDLKTN